MNFHPDPAKRAHELIFSHKSPKTISPLLFFNQNHLVQTPLLKHLGIFLDTRLKGSTSVSKLRSLFKR